MVVACVTDGVVPYGVVDGDCYNYMRGLLGDCGVFRGEDREDGLLEGLNVVGVYVFPPSALGEL